MTTGAFHPVATFARNEYSQAGEDGIIERIMQVLPPLDDRCASNLRHGMASISVTRPP